MGGVVYEDVNLTGLFDGYVYDALAMVLFDDVSGDFYSFPAGFFDDLDGLLGVGFLFFEVGDQNIRPFPRKSHRHRPPDAGVLANNNGLLSFEPSGTFVGLVTVVGPGTHLRFETGVLIPLVLLTEFRFRILLFWILLTGLIVGHRILLQF